MLKIIENCPSCDHTLERINNQLFCRNKQCNAQTAKKLEHFAKTMRIRGLGAKTIEKLNISEISQIYLLEEETLIELLGEKVGQKLNQEIVNSLNADLPTIIESFSIPLIGNTAAKKIAATVTSIWDITVEKCKEAGLGEKATVNLITFIEDEKELLNSLPFSYSSNKTINTIFRGSLVITGKLRDYSSRELAKAMLEKYGFKVTDSVTKNTNYLIDEEGVESSKRKKAESLNIPILTIKELLTKENIDVYQQKMD